MNNNKLKLIIFIVTIAVLFAGVVGTWYVYGEDIEHNKESITKIDEKGSETARDNKSKIGLIEYRLDSIDTKQQELTNEQKAMRKENEEAFREILKRLPE